jgi:hypothetical protein
MKNSSRRVLSGGVLVILLPLVTHAQREVSYTTYGTFQEVLQASGARYPALIRVSDPEVDGKPAYTGFFFYQCLQFDTSGRYLLAMRVYFQNRLVQSSDRADIGLVDLKNQFKWTKIGESTAWNWQQGARLQWRPGSEEIVWNDRSDDGKHYVCRVYDFRTGKNRTLPRPIYDVSPDGATALTHDFERMKHAGTDYVGIEDKYKDQIAPQETGIWKMNLNTGSTQLIMSLDKMAAVAYPSGRPTSGCLYFFREGWNPSGTRFVAFIKDPANNLFEAYSMTANGTDVRYLYRNPSHHSWLDENHIIDFGKHTPPGSSQPQNGYFLFKDDRTGRPQGTLWNVDFDGHNSYVPNSGNDWIISDTYSLNGFQHLFLYHVPTKRFVPLAKLKSTAGQGIHRVDLHPRLSRDGKIVSVDATHEGLGRQMYMMDISHIVDNPPRPVNR